MQIHGGYGYCSEYPVEQFLRDVKITSIYEGTNGIQALDLVGRKLVLSQGALFRSFVEVTGEMSAKARQNPQLQKIVDLLMKRNLSSSKPRCTSRRKLCPKMTIPVLYATPYQELFGDVAIGYMLMWQAEAADRKLQDIYDKAGADTAEKKNELLTANKEQPFTVEK